MPFCGLRMGRGNINFPELRWHYFWNGWRDVDLNKGKQRVTTRSFRDGGNWLAEKKNNLSGCLVCELTVHTSKPAEGWGALQHALSILQPKLHKAQGLRDLELAGKMSHPHKLWDTVPKLLRPRCFLAGRGVVSICLWENPWGQDNTDLPAEHTEP